MSNDPRKIEKPKLPWRPVSELPALLPNEKDRTLRSAWVLMRVEYHNGRLGFERGRFIQSPDDDGVVRWFIPTPAVVVKVTHYIEITPPEGERND